MEDRQHLYLIHGFAGSPDNWAPLINELDGLFSITTYTLPGHGDRGDVQGPFNIERCPRELCQLISEDGTSNAILIGHSMGSRIAVEACSQQTDKVSALVLVDGSNCPINSVKACEAIQSTINNIGFPAAMFETMKGFLIEGIRSDLRDQLLQGSQRLNQVAALGYTESMAKWDSNCFLGQIDSIKIPVAILQSTSLSEDEAVTRHYIKQKPDSRWTSAWELKPNVHIERISDCGHYTMIEKPEAVVNAIDSAVVALS